MATSLEHDPVVDQQIAAIDGVKRAYPHNGHIVNDERIERVLLNMPRPPGDEALIDGLPVPIWSADSMDGRCDRCRNLTQSLDRALYVPLGVNVAVLTFCRPCASYLDNAFAPLIWAP